MNFTVSRTSNFDQNAMPCEEAQSFPRKAKDGTWHPVWYVTIETLDELLDFCTRCGEEVVIHKEWGDENQWHLEIYDDYRE